MKRAPGRTLAGVGLAAAGALVVLVVVVARSRSEPPARCVAGMVALGPRCCGEGQSLEQDHCAGVPARCAAGMALSRWGAARSLA